MKSLALFILLAALALAVTVVKFPEDFSREVVGGVLALYAPQATCPVIEVREVFTDKLLASLLGITPNLTNPKASFYIAETLRAAAEAAGGRVYSVGVLSHSPPAGFVATSPLNITEFARRVGGVKAVVIVLPWNITTIDDVEVEIKLLQELEKHPEWEKAEAFMQKARLEKARALRSWLMGNDSALSPMDSEKLREAVKNSRGDDMTLRRAVKRFVEVRVGKPFEKVSDEELAELLPYFVWAPVLMPAWATVKDTFFGIPAVHFAAIRGSNMTIDGVRAALLSAVKALNCTPSVIYTGETDIRLFSYDVLIDAEEQAAELADGNSVFWLPAAIAISAAAAVAIFLTKRK
ncbi:MAG: hypothetical protein QW680_11090 [Pyrobaculum sp.]|jgi:hypothetical protein|uniref:hypothetical protein n=1 Tax=Pyrobaculum sp. TaxID=2004705 RepID=UPI00317922BF